jgi:RimJ/RimL family protein N-acetyltransferase
MEIHFTKLTESTSEIAEAFSRWENDPSLIPFSRPNKNQDELEKQHTVTLDELMQRLEHHQIYLMYLGEQLIGVMDYRMDPDYLFKKESGTAWIGITIGEESGRGKGIGHLALQYLEEQIRLQGLKRIELGVFEFNANAIKLYQKLGYVEIGRIQDFTYWKGQMWQDIRMEKYI